MTLDRTDFAILSALQEDARLSNKDRASRHIDRLGRTEMAEDREDHVR